MPARFTFRKKERLCGRKALQEIALKGKSMVSGPIRLLWLPLPSKPDPPARAAFSVPKKTFRNAADRNKIKRRMREAYRKNKHSLYALLHGKEVQYRLLFVYIARDEKSYQDIEDSTEKLIAQLSEDAQKNNR